MTDVQTKKPRYGRCLPWLFLCSVAGNDTFESVYTLCENLTKPQSTLVLLLLVAILIAVFVLILVLVVVLVAVLIAVLVIH